MTVEALIARLRADRDRPRRAPHHGGDMLLACLEALVAVSRGEEGAQLLAVQALERVVRLSRMR